MPFGNAKQFRFSDVRPRRGLGPDRARPHRRDHAVEPVLPAATDALTVRASGTVRSWAEDRP